jgi:hypothetical protein
VIFENPKSASSNGQSARRIVVDAFTADELDDTFYFSSFINTGVGK